MVNTEKPTRKQEAKKTAVVKPTKEIVNKMPIKKEEKVEDKNPEEKKEIKKETTVKKIKKTEAKVVGKSLPISTKYAVSICKFIKDKEVSLAIQDLEQVLNFKKAVPMKGEIPHRKGKKMSSGRYPKKASENFIMLLKSLQSNAIANEIENPLIVEAMANMASRPFGRFGRIKKKRTHVKLIAKEKKLKEIKK